MSCLEVSGLGHRYSRDVILEHIDLCVPEGAIYAFLGPNGAGKTTTLRLILGLLTVQVGRICVFGQRLDMDRIAILAKVGSMIEGPSSYDHLSARDNLEVSRRIHRCPASRIDEVLKLVGLRGTGSKKVRQFSLGMKQRLAIGTALLHSPKLLVLDEPTNGLDADGMIEMRHLLAGLNREHGTTILISSHLLAEVGKLATHVGVISGGRMVFEGTIDQLGSRAPPTVRLSTSDDPRAATILAAAGIESQFVDGKIVVPAMSADSVADVNRQLVESGIGVHDIGIARRDLESLYTELIGVRA